MPFDMDEAFKTLRLGEDDGSTEGGSKIFTVNTILRPFSLIFVLEKHNHSRSLDVDDELSGNDIPAESSERRRTLRPLVKKYYSEYARMILEELLGERLQSRSGVEQGTLEDGTAENLDKSSSLIWLENLGLNLDPVRGTSGSDSGDSTGMEFLEQCNPPIRAALITFLLPHYASRGERYATHFRVWFIPGFRTQLFTALEEVVKSERVAAELAELRNIRCLTDEELGAYDEGTHAIFESNFQI